MAKKTIYTSATFEDTLELRTQELSGVVNPFLIEAGSVVQVVFKGDLAPVILSTANVGEVTVLDANSSTIKYVGSPTKAALLTTGKDVSIDVLVTQGISGKVIGFEAKKYADIFSLDNE